jgi:hypothetical protein
MEGLLIFVSLLHTDIPGVRPASQAGLFSAVLTAFIIESYKTLNSDSGDLTVQLLSRSSAQLAASANGTTFNIPPSSSFVPHKASIVSNALWFIALGLSLACAVIATLIEQWGREFLHRADMRSPYVIRARMFWYLYYGLKRSHMHTVVEIIPLLLHASLLFFFGGLEYYHDPDRRRSACHRRGRLYHLHSSSLVVFGLPVSHTTVCELLAASADVQEDLAPLIYNRVVALVQASSPVF